MAFFKDFGTKNSEKIRAFLGVFMEDFRTHFSADFRARFPFEKTCADFDSVIYCIVIYY